MHGLSECRADSVDSVVMLPRCLALSLKIVGGGQAKILLGELCKIAVSLSLRMTEGCTCGKLHMWLRPQVLAFALPVRLHPLDGIALWPASQYIFSQFT